MLVRSSLLCEPAAASQSSLLIDSHLRGGKRAIYPQVVGRSVGRQVRKGERERNGMTLAV